MNAVIIGSGVAGLSCALAALDGASADGLTLITPVFSGEATRGSSPLAQGGIACALAATDSPAAHLHDTLAAGHSLVDVEAATQLTFDGVGVVTRLVKQGLAVDRDAAGALTLGLEAAHGCHRIVHCGGDRSGAVLHAHLVERATRMIAAGRLELREGHEARRLILRDGVIAGVQLDDGTILAADAVIIATGGYGALYPRSSNHPATRGSGIALAARAGALIADMEFVQFHPTVLDPAPAGLDPARAGLDPAQTGERGFLISEAVRGAGAVLRDAGGRRFMPRFDERAELAPRDVVSRAIDQVLREGGRTHVFLDATGIESLATRFPQITAATKERGLDWQREPIAVAPAAHYSMGGIATDLDGRTSIPGLFAVGEAASTGVHGANRLASNSLLEGLVFGARAAAALGRPWAHRGQGFQKLEILEALTIPEADSESASSHSGSPGTAVSGDVNGVGGAALESVRAAVGTHLGITREASGIAMAHNVAASVVTTVAPSAALSAVTSPLAAGSDAGIIAMLIAAGAEARTESRGAHQRLDYPLNDPALARRTAFSIKEINTCSPQPSSAPPSPAPWRKTRPGAISAQS
ncbi:L-aspartate oxidase [Corynebacterium flavescens]|uniref:L-aspartate oxidase n=1 Tax=Corynebacterium flavescens TaxID=28028 RepID=UPI003FCF7BBA